MCCYSLLEDEFFLYFMKNWAKYWNLWLAGNQEDILNCSVPTGNYVSAPGARSEVNIVGESGAIMLKIVEITQETCSWYLYNYCQRLLCVLGWSFDLESCHSKREEINVVENVNCSIGIYQVASYCNSLHFVMNLWWYLY